jgi:malonyl-CoA/methylmalonyl-CoA synthetase
LLYSSGTTGVPKGAKITHANLAANAKTLVDAWGFTPTDTLLHALPVYHAHGLFVGLGCVLMSGANMQFLPRFSAAAVCAALPGSTVFMGVPTYYSRLLNEPGLNASACAHMRLFISGSAPLPETLLHAFAARTGHTILERYGMTETGMNASNPLTGERRPGTVGPALPGVELRVTDAADQPLPAGAVGHLQVRGPNVFSGYWRTGGATRDDFTADGFFRTGDLAAIAADGYVTIAGRSRDLIITGGLNVYPRELENALDSLPDVQESAVIGVPHDDYGEAVVAVVVATDPAAAPDAAQLTEALRQRLAAYKLPKRVVVVDALPRNSMGKVQKNRLREHYADLFSVTRGDAG